MEFVNTECNLVHGNMRTSSVFISESGEWKLAGFEISTLKTNNESLFFTPLPNLQKYQAPEQQSSSWLELRKSNLDSWFFGLFLYECLYSNIKSPTEMVKQVRIPTFRKLLQQTHRMSITDFIAQGTFN